MQTLYLEGLHRILHPGRENETITERIINNLGTSNLGLDKKTAATASVYDSFSITKNISELLSPACGMTEEEKQAYLAKIRAKLQSGKKLTGEEMRFLQAEDPVLYQQAARVQSMRESLEARLAHATSKENATSIYADALSHIADEDPMKEYLVAAYDDAMKEFRESDTYQALPDTEREAQNERLSDTEKKKK